MSSISDPVKYVSDMHRSLLDKLFFAGVVDASRVVDFGCADGALMAAYQRMFPTTEVLGYDLCPDMVATAEATNRHLSFTSHWDDVVQWLVDTKWRGCSAIVLSSVLHEVYSYLEGDQLAEFVNKVWYDVPFDYVIIRDMMVSETVNRTANSEDVARVRQMASPDMVAEWENRWGSIDENRSMLHFLLTYQYPENWNYEIRENYLPHNVEQFLAKVPGQYRPIYFEHYTLPYFRGKVERDFGISVTDRTHVKMVFERRT